MITTVVKRVVYAYIGYRIGVYAAEKISEKIERKKAQKAVPKFYKSGRQETIYTTFVEEV